MVSDRRSLDIIKGMLHEVLFALKSVFHWANLFARTEQKAT